MTPRIHGLLAAGALAACSLDGLPYPVRSADAGNSTDTGRDASAHVDAPPTPDTGTNLADATSGPMGTLTGTALNYSDFVGFPGLTVTTCAASDLACTNPLGTATTNAMGMFTIPYPLTAGAFNGYFQFTGGSGSGAVMPTRSFVTLSGAAATSIFGLVPLATFNALAGLFPTGLFDSAHGAVTYAVRSATAFVSGAVVTATPSAGLPFYLASGLPSLSAMQTDASGQGGFLLTPQGTYTFTATHGDAGVTGTQTASVRGNFVTAFILSGM